jgi:RNA polymerase sigma-70 factor (ECF subfamily)
MTDDERRIIQTCLDGNHDAFSVLVNRYEIHVKALAWNITGNPEDAMEVCQDAFLQAFKNLDRFDPDRDFKNWLLGITAKRGIDRLRKRKTFMHFFLRYAEEAPLSNPEIKPIEESEIFHPLMKRLNERERIALSLQMNESFTAKEIGQVLDCSENSVRVLLFNARKKLKKELLAVTSAPARVNEVVS